MSFTVSVSEQARKDARRLDDWLRAHDVQAAERLGSVLRDALISLTEMPLRGRIAGSSTREINVPFGRDAYIIRYSVRAKHVTITRIWHSLEHR